MESKKLKSLRSLGAFDGEKEHAEIPRDVPLPKCNHKDVKMISGSEMRCKCGAGWRGINVSKLYKLFTT
jgi:hypothetical protein